MRVICVLGGIIACYLVHERLAYWVGYHASYALIIACYAADMMLLSGPYDWLYIACNMLLKALGLVAHVQHMLLEFCC